MDPKEINWEELSSIIDGHKDEKWALIPLLQEVQEKFGYVPPQAIEPIAVQMHGEEVDVAILTPA